jgi:hypothetical protein
MMRHHLPVALLAIAAFSGPPARAQDGADFARIDRMMDAWQPTRDERRFDDIAWADDIRAALKLGKDNNRPIFLFTHKGRMNVGRC